MHDLVFKNVSKTFSPPSWPIGFTKKNLLKKKVINNLSLSAAKNVIIGVAGKNGSGKTTFLKLICGILIPDEGEIKIYGKSPLSPEAKLKTGYLLSERGMYWRLTARENLNFFSKIYGTGIHEEKHHIHKLLKLLNVEPATYDKRMDLLSSGEKKKFAIIKMLMTNPSIILLDEPDKNLDAETLKNFNALLKKEKSAGKTIFYVSHNLRMLKEISDEIILLESGRAAAHFKNKREFPFLEIER